MLVGPVAMNSRPALPSSSHSISEVSLPVLLGSAGCWVSGSISSSNAWKDESAAWSANLKKTPLTTVQNNAAATAMPITYDTRFGTIRPSIREMNRNVT